MSLIPSPVKYVGCVYTGTIYLRDSNSRAILYKRKFEKEVVMPEVHYYHDRLKMENRADSLARDKFVAWLRAKATTDKTLAAVMARTDTYVTSDIRDIEPYVN
jgi:hypothetical protein